MALEQNKNKWWRLALLQAGWVVLVLARAGWWEGDAGLSEIPLDMVTILLPLARRCGVDWGVESVNPPSPFLDLPVVLRNLRGALGLWCTRGVLGHALALVVWARLSGVCLQMERLSLLFAAGRLRRRVAGVRLARCGAPFNERVGGGAGAAEVGLARLWPMKFGWLVWQVGWQAAGYGGQLRAVLETPGMVALLDASPQVGRMLRPICRMLAVETSLLRLPARVRRVAVTEADVPAPDVAAGAGGVARKRVRKMVEPWRIPLPRGVLTAARRQGYGRIPSEKG